MSTLRQFWKPDLAAALVLTAGYLSFRRPATTVRLPTPSDAEPKTPTGQGPTAALGGERTYEIVTLLPRDAIPAIDEPGFYSAAEA